MKMRHLVSLTAPMLMLAWTLASQAADSAAPTTCKDGTTSTATGRGACSGHGGVQKAVSSTAPAATPPPASVAPPAASSPPATVAKPAATTSKSTAASGAAASSTTTSGNTDPTGATAKCKDGTYSKSQHKSGTCSKHGGVAEWLNGAH